MLLSLHCLTMIIVRSLIPTIVLLENKIGTYLKHLARKKFKIIGLFGNRLFC